MKPEEFIELKYPNAIIKIVIAYDDVIQYGMLEDDVYEIMGQYADSIKCPHCGKVHSLSMYSLIVPFNTFA